MTEKDLISKDIPYSRDLHVWLCELLENLERLGVSINSIERRLRELTLSASIEDLELSIRSTNCLMNEGIMTISDLLKYSPHDLFKFKNLGKKSLDEIIYALKWRGLRLARKSTGDK